MKKIFLYIILLSLPFLTGCFESENNQTVEFDGFVMEINEHFIPISSGTFDGQQIQNKIIASYKIDSLEDIYKDNLIISKNKLNNKIDLETYTQANYNKLNKGITTLNSIENIKKLDFECKNDKIDGYYSKYEVYDSIFDEDTKYYILQYYFIKDDNGYILSFSSGEDRFSEFIKNIGTISCN
ncbi:hypothetical protein [Candidatus Vampirococcus lugosii]|uniref:PsbP C-terminal domain-containing protein n=1 Tax=Candidatus Vampirococcus lugosii TaxID=2789015 RepID=A0ABS5QJY2_9BACT|nr:hypothetical protein [Candidatus Vampirococcus lugosii]MBS8121552.1 hypothetical protein [Candidatus Vampirococcus lugosii]